MNTRRNTIPASDWFDHNFIFGFLISNLDVKEKLNEKRFRLEEAKISSRVLNHWIKEGLVSDDRQSNKGWRKFSISEIIWIQIIIKLRKFGFELNKIKKVKDYLVLNGTSENQSKFPELDFYISYGRVSNTPVKLLVFESGEALLGRQLEIDMAIQIGTIKDDYISIDLNKLFSSFVNNKNVSTDYLNYSTPLILKEVQKSIISDDFKSLKININGKDEYILDSEYIKSSKYEVERLLNIFEYAKASTIKQGNKKIHVLSRKQKIKGRPHNGYMK